jgi:rubrerythrin
MALLAMSAALAAAEGSVRAARGLGNAIMRFVFTLLRTASARPAGFWAFAQSGLPLRFDPVDGQTGTNVYWDGSDSDVGIEMTERFESVDEILDFAIANEVEAGQFYTDLAAKMDDPAMRKAFEDFAREEQGHKAKLEAVKRGEYPFEAKAVEIQTLGLADYLVESEPKPDMSYAEALILAMKKEKAAYRLYLDLAAISPAGDLTDLFMSLAAEEAKHKLRFEIEYDDNVLKED